MKRNKKFDKFIYEHYTIIEAVRTVGKSCCICGSKKNLLLHHIDYKLKIGFTVCNECHKDIHRRLRTGKKRKECVSELKEEIITLKKQHKNLVKRLESLKSSGKKR